MFLVKMLTVSLVALFSVSAWAGLPMAKRSFTSSQEFASRVQSGNDMNATAAEYFAALQEYHPDAMRGLSGVGEYSDNLEIVPCPQNVLYRLKSVEISPRGLGEIMRHFKPGEQCFFDRNIGEIVASASCGNVAVEANPAPKPVPRVEVPREVPRPVQVEMVSCPNGYYLADRNTCCADGTELSQDGRCYPPPQQYREPPQQQVTVVEEYGGLDVGGIAYGWGLSRSGDRYNYHYEDNDNYQYEYTDNRRYYPPPPHHRPPPPDDGGGPVNPNPPPYDDGGPVNPNPPPYDGGGPANPNPYQ